MSVELTKKIQKMLSKVPHPTYEPSTPYGGWEVDHIGLVNQAAVWVAVPGLQYSPAIPPPVYCPEWIELCGTTLYVMCRKDGRVIYLRFRHIGQHG